MTIKEAHRRALGVATAIKANTKTYDNDEPSDYTNYRILKKAGYLDVTG